jgi:hypothetical protein
VKRNLSYYRLKQYPLSAGTFCSNLPLETTGIFAGKPIVQRPSMRVVNGKSVASYVTACVVTAEHSFRGSVVGFAVGNIIFYDETQNFGLLPIYIDDCFGLFTEWDEPKCGQPIATTHPLKSWSTAQSTFAAWAQQVFENHWRNYTPVPWPRRRRQFLKRLMDLGFLQPC